MNRDPYGFTTKEFKTLKELVITPLNNLGAKVWIFGSRAKGTHKPFSDIDLLVEGNVSQNLIAKIAEQLDDSALPYKVDIVLKDHLAESYKNNVEAEQKLLK